MRAGRGQFTAVLEVQEGQRLMMSFLHHMALQRLCRNPFEKGEVAGLTNYLDVGLQVPHAPCLLSHTLASRRCLDTGPSAAV